MKPTPSPQDQKIIELLENLETPRVEYPPELLAARRAAFLAQVQQYKQGEIETKPEVEAPAGRQFTRRLKELQSVREEYPRELLAARRSAFISQIEKYRTAEVREELASKDQDILKLLKTIKSAEPEYPAKLLAARRSVFRRQLARGSSITLLETWLASLQNLLRTVRLPSLPVPSIMRTSAILALLMITVYAASTLGRRGPVYQPAPTQEEIAQPVPVQATNTEEVAKVICKDGYLPPLCLAKEFNPSQDLTYQGNGVARPAVAKDTLPGYDGVHKPDYVNDGLYGPGASWISNSAYSWIKIDLGKATTINTVTFGRDRLGNFNDGDPGQFVIAVALSDDVYQDGNSSKDYMEYTQVYHSSEDGFTGVISGPETIKAAFRPITARYVKIIFTNARTAVDEVEVFMVQPPVVAENPTRRPKDDELSVVATAVIINTPVPTNTASPIPTNTPLPTDTSVPTDTPTDVPTDTPTPEPTSTPRPTRTPTPEPTSTPAPTETPGTTDTPEPVPTETSEPFLGSTPTVQSSFLDDIP
jgi:hypothetical protein